ncbi:MAG TPA: ATP-binding cassette domain-containing protein [Spirochaetota bacterium]|nr:ATP-binding cassette domain-containing protein [Spirochaetota bacterium]HOD14273.1 ATP-binding cassette domain-containing protein [Spirochaetota bacterium]HPG50594.1 ATP-binding cassette domain-containing protein [Spirochaetota bacterium]HPN12195.1 ATP-binding cassette domain-containing protein [Spirochaetota bacterium]HQL83526.1 ATP-binding cassette domain-containing protein [Spirochaetota bacterium]
MTPLVEFKNVSCEAPGYEPLAGLSFSLREGENAVFFGIEGSGIKTITPLLLGVEGRCGGEIMFRGEPVGELDYLARLRYLNRIGYLHGDYGLLSNKTVEQNISLRLEYYSEYSREEIRAITTRLMTDLRILDRRAARPVELTRSQILRTAYARAVAHNPDLLLIEFALIDQSPLDIISFMDVMRSRTANPEKSVMFMTYEPQKFVDFADAFHMLYQGRIVFSGTRDDFFRSGNPFLAQYRDVSLRGPMDIR